MRRCCTTCAVWLALSLSILSAHGQDTLCFEAESMVGIVVPMEIAGEAPGGAERETPPAAKNASGNRYIEITEGRGNPPKVTAGEATFVFIVKKAGTYFLWCRVWWNGECSNSFTMNADDGPPFAFGQDGTYNGWHWVKAPQNLKQLNFSEGRHTLTVKNREDGVRIDQVLLTVNRNYVPVDIEPATIAASEPVSKPAAPDKGTTP